MRLNTGKSQDDPRYKPPAQTNRPMNPMFAKILKIATKMGYPQYYKRDLSIDRNAISRKHPSAIIWGIRDTGTELVCLSRGTRKSASKGPVLFGSKPKYTWQKSAIDKIEYWSRSGASSPITWYYVTSSSIRKVSSKEAVDIVYQYGGHYTEF